MKKKLRSVFLQLLIILTIMLLLSGSYVQYMTRQVRSESARHLEELFLQVNNNFFSVVTCTWDILHSWDEFILEKSQDEAGKNQLAGFMEDQGAVWGFSDFYFLNKNGNYKSLSGKEGYFDLGDSIFSLMNEGEDIVVNNTLSTGEPIFLFAVPVKEGKIGDFSFRAIGVTYHQNSLISLLEIHAFDNSADCYIVEPNGMIAMTSRKNNTETSYNFFANLEEHAQFQYRTLEMLRSDIENGKKGLVEYREDGTEYYLSYMPVGLEHWSLLGVIPKNTVNANMNSLQVVTMIVTATLFLALSFLIIYSLVRRNRLLIHGKDVELKYREQLFNLLAVNVDDVFVMFSAGSAEVEYVSPNIERLLGLSLEQVKADVSTLEQAVPEETPKLSATGDLAIGENTRQDGYMMNLRTGEKRWYCGILYHEMVEGSEKYILILSDRTDEKKNDERLLQALDVAENANAAKSTFLSNMSHDIRTPLNGIIGMTVIAQANLKIQEKVEDCLNKISFSSKHLLGLINDILDMSKIESGKMTLSDEQFSIDRLVDGVMELIRPQAAAKNQKLNTVLKIEERNLSGDPLRLNQVLLNLLSNAVKYTQEDGEILFSVEELNRTSENYVRFRFAVEDNGCGMTKEYMKTLFDPFSREGNTRVSKIQGTGLGMSICKGIVELMGGTIQVQSAPGEGSRFTVELALRMEKEQLSIQENPEEQENKAFDYHGRRFLVAEDNELNAEIICELLGMQGAEVVLAHDGREAAEQFERSSDGYYDAILMDIQMPVMNGYDSTRLIRKYGRADAGTIPIIAMTADAFAEDIKQAGEAGMDAHVAKPVDMNLLSDALHEVLGA